MKNWIYLLFVLAMYGCGDEQSSENNLSNNKLATDSSKMENKIYPKDESKRDTSLVSFISKLKDIAENKDTAELRKVLHNNVAVSYGGAEYGVKSFFDNWGLEKPEESRLWDYLQQIIEMGGTWESNRDEKGNESEYFIIPYAQSDRAWRNIKNDFYWNSSAVCTSPYAKVYENPSLESKAIAALNYDVVEMSEENTDENFTQIISLNKKVKGYVQTSKLDFSASPNLNLSKYSGVWIITSFAPYD